MDRAGLQAAVGYFPVRVAPLGAIPPVVAQALMPFFPVPLVSKMVERSRATIAPDELRVLVQETMTIAAGDVYGAFEGLEELNDLLTRAAAACDLDGRPLTAAWRTYAWEGAAAQLFGAATVLREHRGEGHWFALAAAGVSGDEAHVFSQLRQGATRTNMSHGFRPEQVDVLIAALDSRGWTSGGVVTGAGEAFHAAIEAQTDTLDAAPWDAIGAEGVARVVELGASLPKP